MKTTPKQQKRMLNDYTANLSANTLNKLGEYKEPPKVDFQPMSYTPTPINVKGYVYAKKK